METYTIKSNKNETLVVDISGRQKNLEYRVEKKSVATIVLLSLHSKKSDTNVTVRLVGRGSEAIIIGIIVARGNSEIRLHTLQSHEAPETTSNLLVKSALKDSSVCFYDGGIRVEKEAQKTDAYQRNENILLSQNAHAESKPALEILANDVRCTHGATVGPVSKEELWYLSTRGIGEAKAESLIVEGFFRSAVDRVADEDVRNSIWQTVQRAI